MSPTVPPEIGQDGESSSIHMHMTQQSQSPLAIDGSIITHVAVVIQASTSIGDVQIGTSTLAQIGSLPTWKVEQEEQGMILLDACMIYKPI